MVESKLQAAEAPDEVARQCACDTDAYYAVGLDNYSRPRWHIEICLRLAADLDLNTDARR